MMETTRNLWPQALEVGRLGPGHYLVEGRTVRRRYRRNGKRRVQIWAIDDTGPTFRCLVDALRHIAEETQ